MLVPGALGWILGNFSGSSPDLSNYPQQEVVLRLRPIEEEKQYIFTDSPSSLVEDCPEELTRVL